MRKCVATRPCGIAWKERETDKFFAYTGKRKAADWEQFGNEFVLGQIRKAMTSVARENNGWPTEWNDGANGAT
jgi:hypothetical protein